MESSPVVFRLKKQWFVSSKAENIEDEYRFENVLGEGGFGKVYKAESLRTGQMVAIKEIQKMKVEDYENLMNELSILKELDHPNIVRVIETYETHLKCYLVMELCEGGQLLDKVCEAHCLSEAYVAACVRSLLSALAYCHQHKICHRDVKPENVLMVSADPASPIKLIDFGLGVRHTEASVMSGISGTIYYIAPEMLAGNYTNKVDCWSLGVLMYFMLSGTLPFTGESAEEVLMNVYNAACSLHRPELAHVSPLAKDLIVRLLTKNTEIRLSCEQALTHPWVQTSVSREPVPLAVYEKLNEFMTFQRLKRATLMLLASKLSNKSLKDLNEVFQGMDSDANGRVSKAEFCEAMHTSNIGVDPAHLEALWAAIDTNWNDWIDYSEFIAACFFSRKALNQDYLEAAFRFFDRVSFRQNGDGKISVEELRCVLDDNDRVNKIRESDILKMIREVDRNQDGFVDYKEFLAMMGCSPEVSTQCSHVVE